MNNLQIYGDINELGVIGIAYQSLASVLSSRKNQAMVCPHGIRQISILEIQTSDKQQLAMLLVCSSDIPAFVSYQKVTDSVDYYDWKGTKLPLLKLLFQTIEITEISKF
jgi:hypothetical protein